MSCFEFFGWYKCDLFFVGIENFLVGRRIILDEISGKSIEKYRFSMKFDLRPNLGVVTKFDSARKVGHHVDIGQLVNRSSAFLTSRLVGRLLNA